LKIFDDKLGIPLP